MYPEPRTLEAQIDFPTCYEIVFVKGEASHRVAFTARKTKQCLFDNLIANGPELLALMDTDEDFELVYKDKEWRLGATGWAIRYSGWTERNCASKVARGEGA